jgi:hypothetical protein
MVYLSSKLKRPHLFLRDFFPLLHRATCSRTDRGFYIADKQIVECNACPRCPYTMRTDHDRGFVVSAGKGAVFMTSTNLIGIIQKSSANLGALRIPNNQGTLCDLIRMGTQNR